MSPQRFLPACRVALALVLAAAFSTRAQLTINGVADKGIYANAATLTVVTQAGFTYSVSLDGGPAAAGVAVAVSQPDYHELRVTRVETATSAVTNRLVRFLIYSSERGDTEYGLPPHTPWPIIQSSPAEFAAARLRLVTPRDFPAGYDIPVVAWVEEAGGHAVRANGLLTAPGQPAIQIRRGVGSGFLSATSGPPAVNYSASVGGLSATQSIALDLTTWTTIAADITADTVWPAGARLHLNRHLVIAAAATLTIEEGVIVRLDAGLAITNHGRINVTGSAERPVVFMPSARAQPWGGFVLHAGNARFTASGAIFTGSGAEPCWYSGEGCGSSVSGLSSHRGEQALFALRGAGVVLSLTDCAAISLAGQLGHSVGGGGNSYSITLQHFLMQRCTTGGEYTDASLVVNDSAFLECPDDTPNFVNGDNDALYIVNGSHAFTNTLFGWTKDDGVDSGGSGYGPLNYEQCWFEATFHEGNSLSGYKNTTARRTVYLDCGQGIEDGYDSPTGRVENCFFSQCESGLRHGDNYTTFSGYFGNVTATDCILLHNHRDVFGFNWKSGTGNGWTNASGQMVVTNNRLTAADSYFPDNLVWNPASDGHRLAAFGGKGRVGVGLAVRAGQAALANFPNGIPVGLSVFSTNEVTVDYVIAGTDGTSAGGTLVFPAGQTRAFIPLPGDFTGVLRVALANPVHADVTGAAQLLFQNISAPGVAVLSPLGATWKYLDTGTDQGAAWQGTNFNDSAWSNGVARLGFGPDAAAVTTLRRYYSGTSGPQITNYYFRRAFVVTNPADFATLQFRYQRDDGCVVHLNGAEAFRNNMPGGAITYLTLASTTISGAAATQQFWTNTLPASFLRPGANVIAVEVHQASATSSDIAWEMECRGLPAPPPARVNLSRLGGEPVVYWGDGAFTLEQAGEVTGPWTPAAPPTSPAAPGTNAARQFFRLRK